VELVANGINAEYMIEVCMGGDDVARLDGDVVEEA
jgi:hypothetical protein